MMGPSQPVTQPLLTKVQLTLAQLLKCSFTLLPNDWPEWQGLGPCLENQTKGKPRGLPKRE